MILSQKQIEEIAAAVTRDFNEFFFGCETDKARIARATPIDQFATDYLSLDVSFARLSSDGSIYGLTAYENTEYIIGAAFGILSWLSCPLVILLAYAPWVAGTLNTVDYLLICMLPLFCAKLAISMPQLVEEVPRPLRNVMDAVALTSVFAGALALLRFKEETFDDMPPSIRDDILSHFFMSDVEIAEIEAEKEQNETSIERSREELEMEAKATLAKFNNRAPKRTFGTEKTNRG